MRSKWWNVIFWLFILFNTILLYFIWLWTCTKFDVSRPFLSHESPEKNPSDRHDRSPSHTCPTPHRPRDSLNESKSAGDMRAYYKVVTSGWEVEGGYLLHRLPHWESGQPDPEGGEGRRCSLCTTDYDSRGFKEEAGLTLCASQCSNIDTGLLEWTLIGHDCSCQGWLDPAELTKICGELTQYPLFDRGSSDNPPYLLLDISCVCLYMECLVCSMLHSFGWFAQIAWNPTFHAFLGIMVKVLPINNICSPMKAQVQVFVGSISLYSHIHIPPKNDVCLPISKTCP